MRFQLNLAHRGLSFFGRKFSNSKKARAVTFLQNLSLKKCEIENFTFTQIPFHFEVEKY